MARTRRSQEKHRHIPGNDVGSEVESLQNLLARLKDLDARMTQIEMHLGLGSASDDSAHTSAADAQDKSDSEDALETQVGENWFAKVGIVVLALGVIFLLTFPYQGLPAIAPSAIGYFLVACIFAFSWYWRASFEQVSHYMLGGGLLLLYFTTLRLAHFSPEPVVTDNSVELLLLIAVVVFNLVVSARRQSPYLTVLNIALASLTALAGGGPLVVFTITTATIVTAAEFSVRFRWTWILTAGTVLAYFAHLLWAMNNPVFGNSVQLMTSPEINLPFVLVYAAIAALGQLRQLSPEKEDALSVVNSVVNGFGSFLLLTGLAFTAFRSSFALWELVASALYLGIAITFWVRLKSKFATFIYAMLGYAALSAAIADLSIAPDVFVWLCWQSILVLSTAVWFRSRFIVVANFFIYLLIFIAYLSLAGTIGTISVSFGIVALLSARILNWRKDRLELKTELMRNAYLACALFVLPYALYHVVPAGYVSLSWLGLALFYYIASRILKNNRKYRWMALLTTILTILYVFTIELVGVDPAWRIVSFLVLGSALLTVSMIYSKRRRKN